MDRLADKLDLPALRMRAFQHIMSELTAQNIPAEVFSRFSSTFEDVRKVCRPLPRSSVHVIRIRRMVQWRIQAGKLQTG